MNNMPMLSDGIMELEPVTTKGLPRAGILSVNFILHFLPSSPVLFNSYSSVGRLRTTQGTKLSEEIVRYLLRDKADPLTK
jgi:hypothetical protein